MVKQSIEKPVSERNDFKFKGIRKRNWGKWVSEIRLPNSRERIWLGSYDTAEKAARAFDAALFCLRGPNAKFNFPDNPPDIFDGQSLKKADIQAAAARFANSEPLKSYSGHDSMPKIQMESLSPSSISEESGTVQLGSDLALDESFLDLFTTMGSGNYASEFGLYPGFDDFSGELFSQPLIPMENYGEEDVDGVIPQESFLWNF